MTDYEKSLARLARINLPKIHLGQEVITPDGKGIVVKLKMNWNGLYLNPCDTEVVVWYSTESAVPIDGSRWVSRIYKLTELTPVIHEEARN